MGKIPALIITGICTVTCCIISIRQFQQKGFLFNNAYIYASKDEREKMDKKPHYRQSGIVFAFLTGVFLCIGLEVILKTGWLMWVEGILLVAVLVYAIASSARSEKRKV